MSAHAELSQRFRNDLLDNYLYITQRDTAAAHRFLTAIHEDCQKLADMPGMGARRDFELPELHQMRSWPVGGFENWLIFYVPTETGIHALRVVHGARDLDTLFAPETE
jgi:toxin ParE1/3/4